MNRKPPHAVLSDDRRTPGGAASKPARDPAEPVGSGALAKRSLVAVLFVAAWIAIGLAGHFSPDAYVLVGMPLMLAFQRWVAGKPLRAAWVFDGTRLRWGWPTWLAGLAIAAGPGWLLLSQLRSTPDDPSMPVHVLWCLAAMGGAFVGAATLRAQHGASVLRATSLIVAVFITGAMGMIANKVTIHAGGFALPSVGVSAGHALTVALTFFGISFVTEEVTFRGMLDPYLREAARGPVQEVVSAMVGSALWGIWHLPVIAATATPDPRVIMYAVVFHAGLGVGLCLIARMVGTLAPTSIVHALTDTLRESIR